MAGVIDRSFARYEVYGHEYFAMHAGLSREKVATICAGERPTDLSRAERAAYDMAAVTLNAFDVSVPGREE